MKKEMTLREFIDELSDFSQRVSIIVDKVIKNRKKTNKLNKGFKNKK